MKLVIAMAMTISICVPAYADEAGFEPGPLPSDPFDPIPLSRPSHTDTYVIDASLSYVKAYVPVWEMQPEASHWELKWTWASYSLSGSFNVETLYSDWDWERSRLMFSQVQITTDAPDYAAFELPGFFAQNGAAVSYSGNPCFDSNFADPPGWIGSCSGWVAGAMREDSGTLQGNLLDVQGSVSEFGRPWDLYTFIDTPEPPTGPIDYSTANGLFEYHLVALAAVPEPETYALMLAGLGLVGWGVSKRRGDSSPSSQRI